MIRTPWLVISMLVAIAAIATLAWWDEHRRSEAELRDFGSEQVSVADSAAVELDAQLADAPAGSGPLSVTSARPLLHALERPNLVQIILVPPSGTPRRLDGVPVHVPALAARLAAADRAMFRVDGRDAMAFGLPARTAMVGVAKLASAAGQGWSVAVAATAERQRDRDRAGLYRLLLSILLAAGLVGVFGGLALARQRARLGLERELAVAEAARARDAELERLSRAATMAALGSGVAHELSTPLGVIVGRAEQLLGRGDERVERSARTILEQANNIDQVVRGLLGFARGAPIALKEVAPKTLVAEAIDLVEHRFARAGVRVAPAFGADLPVVRCEPLLFKHALVNLLLNACDASPRGGTVRIEVRTEGGEVLFVVDDEGHGIAPGAAARATEPFFTTKPVGEGTGLGLAIASEIVSTHRGTLEIGPRAPRGTCAAIKLPIDVGAAHA